MAYLAWRVAIPTGGRQQRQQGQIDRHREPHRVRLPRLLDARHQRQCVGWFATKKSTGRRNFSVRRKSFFTTALGKVNRKMKISGKLVLAARDLLGLTQAELAELAGVSDRTIANFETGKHDPYAATVEKIRAELERRGIEFTNGDGAGVRINYAKAAEFARLSASERNQSGRQSGR